MESERKKTKIPAENHRKPDYPGEPERGFKFYPHAETDGWLQSNNLVKAVEDFEEFFLREKDGALYRFLLSAVEKPLIETVLLKTEGNQIKTAKILGINRNTLRAKIKKLNINARNFRNPRV